VLDPWRDCDVSLDRQNEQLIIEVPATPHVLSAEVSQLPMNAPRVVRRVTGDFTASVHVLGRLEPGPLKTTHYAPYHGAGLIIWQDPGNYLRLERAVGFINGRNHPYINYELREGGRLAVSHGFTIADHPLFLKLRREGGVFTAWYSRDGRRWVALGSVDATFADRVEVGVVAINSSRQTLSAKLGSLNVDDPLGSIARDYGDHDPEAASPPSPALAESPQVRPRRISVLLHPASGPKSVVSGPAPLSSVARDYADHNSERSSPPSPSRAESPQVRPRRTSVLFHPASAPKSTVEPPPPVTDERTGFQW
jgi:regulation of enolase protein 1 (concanavalin A-like superfamily)